MTCCSAQPKNNDTYIVRLYTSKGDMDIELFNDTPIHRDNFIKLVKDGTYQGLAFHRIIKEFMIQGGDPDTKNMQPGKVYGAGDLGYTLDAEIRPHHFHRKGALAAARQGDQVNPEKRSSASQFYIVQGKVYDQASLDNMQKQIAQNRRNAKAAAVVRQYYQQQMQGKNPNDDAVRIVLDSIYMQALQNLPQEPSIDPEIAKVYTTTGGVPHLDGEYTVYGQVIKGIEIIDLIANEPTDQNDCPKQKVEIVKVEIIAAPKGA